MYDLIRRPLRLASLALLVLAATDRVASAQVELDGTFIDYVAIGSDGTMIGANSHSMRYRENEADAYSCDVWATDTPVSSFTIVARSPGLLDDVVATNDALGVDDFATTSATAATGRSVSWTGRATSGLLGGAAVTVTNTYSFEANDRVVVQRVTVVNSGTQTFATVYYMAHGDPDQGKCSIGSSNDTRNDILRQPTNSLGALAVASTIVGASPTVVYGIGSFEGDARADFSSGISDTAAEAAWASPSDPAGAAEDRGVSLVVRISGLAPGASRSFTIFHVWGSSTDGVAARFDAVACSAQAEGGACAMGTSTGTCHAGACCFGCWTGTACSSGNELSSCGIGGGACATCGDGSFCTSGDTCSAGVCTIGVAATCDDALACTDSTCDEVADRCVTTVNTGGCAVDGMCVAAGAASADDACLVCTPATSAFAYTALASCDLDGDGVPNSVESPGGVSMDSDGDGTPDELDPDDDGDGLPTADERADEAALGGDVDGDGTPAYLDTDSDGDGSLDSTEGRPDYLDPTTEPADSDGDGVPDAVECSEQPCMDTDGDGIPDREDTDDDGDGIPTSEEREIEILLGGDLDGDGIPAYLDDDSDGDGAGDADEGGDDSDGDGTPDFADASGGRIVGGALCSTSPANGASNPLLAVIVLALALALRRRGAR